MLSLIRKIIVLCLSAGCVVISTATTTITKVLNTGALYISDFKKNNGRQ